MSEKICRWKFCILLAAFLLITAFSLTVQAIQVHAEGEGKVQVAVGGSVITSGGSKYPGITFDKETCTLTFDNVNFVSPRYADGDSMFPLISARKVSEAGDNLTIRLIGENTLSYENPTGDVRYSQAAVLFRGFSSVTFTGGGTLNIKCGGSNHAGIEFFRATGYLYDDNLNIDGCTINIDASNCSGLAQEDLKGRYAGINDVGNLVLKNGASLNISAKGNNEITDFTGIYNRGASASPLQYINILDSTLTIKETPINANMSKGVCIYNGYLYAGNSVVDINLTESVNGYAVRFQELTSGENISELRVYYSDISLQTAMNNYSRVIEGGTLAEEGSSIYCAGESMDALQEMELSEVIKPGIKYCNYAALKIVPDGSGEDITTGDINQDGQINLVDLMKCLNHVGRKELLEGEALKAADINGDGSVNLVDLMRLLNYVGRKTPTL